MSQSRCHSRQEPDATALSNDVTDSLRDSLKSHRRPAVGAARSPPEASMSQQLTVAAQPRVIDDAQPLVGLQGNRRTSTPPARRVNPVEIFSCSCRATFLLTGCRAGRLEPPNCRRPACGRSKLQATLVAGRSSVMYGPWPLLLDGLSSDGRLASAAGRT